MGVDIVLNITFFKLLHLDKMDNYRKVVAVMKTCLATVMPAPQKEEVIVPPQIIEA